MKIVMARATQKANTGQYEFLEFTAEASFGEDEKVGEVTERLMNYVDWYAQKPVRDPKARKMRSILDDPKAPQEDKDHATAWLAAYDKRRSEVESI